MPDIGIIRPFPYQKAQNLQELLGGDRGFTNGANTLYPRSFVKIDANQALVSSIAVSTAPVSAAATPLVTGFIQEWSATTLNQTAGINPPTVMRGDTDNSTAAFRQRLFPLSVRGMRFAMNITGTTFQIGAANSAPTLADANCIINKELPLIVGGTSTPTPAGTYAGWFAVNVGSTSNPMVRIVDIPQMYKSVNQATRATAYNGIVIVEFLDSVIVGDL